MAIPPVGAIRAIPPNVAIPPVGIIPVGGVGAIRVIGVILVIAVGAAIGAEPSEPWGACRGGISKVGGCVCVCVCVCENRLDKLAGSGRLDMSAIRSASAPEASWKLLERLPPLESGGEPPGVLIGVQS